MSIPSRQPEPTRPPVPTNPPDQPQGPAHLRPAGALARFRAGRLGLTAAGSTAFARGLARTPAVRRPAPLTTGLRENAEVEAPAAARSVRAPRWWSPTPDAQADDAAQRPARTPVAVPPRGLARAASRIDRDSWTPGRLGASAAPKAVPMRLPAEVAAAGSMVTSLDSRRRSVAPSRGPAPQPTGSGPTDGAAGSRRAAGPAAAQTPPGAPAPRAAGAPALPAVRRHTAPPRLARRRAAATRTAASAHAALVGSAVPSDTATTRPTTNAAVSGSAASGIAVSGIAVSSVTASHPTADRSSTRDGAARQAETVPDAPAPAASGHELPATTAVRRASAERHPGTWAPSLPRAASSRSLLGHAPEASAVTRSAPALRRSTASGPRSVARARTGALTLRPTALVRSAQADAGHVPAAHPGSRSAVADVRRATAGADTAPATASGTSAASPPVAGPDSWGPSTTAVAVTPSLTANLTTEPHATTTRVTTTHVPLRRALAVPGSLAAQGASARARVGAPSAGQAVGASARSSAARISGGSAAAASSAPAVPASGSDHVVARAVRHVPGALARRGDVRGAGVATAQPGRVTAVRRQVAVTRRDDAAARTAAVTRAAATLARADRTTTGASSSPGVSAARAAGAASSVSAPRATTRGLDVASSLLPSSSIGATGVGAPSGVSTGSVRAQGISLGTSASRPGTAGAAGATASSSGGPAAAPSSAAPSSVVPTSPASDALLGAGARAVRRATGPATPLAAGGSPAHHSPTHAAAGTHPWGYASAVRRATAVHGHATTTSPAHVGSASIGGSGVVGRATPPVASGPTRRGPDAPATATAWRSSLTDTAAVPLRRSVLPPRAPVRVAAPGPGAPAVPAVGRGGASHDDTAAGLSILRRALARADSAPSLISEEPSMSTLPTTGAARAAAGELHLDERLLARLADALEDDLTDRVARRVERRLLEESALRTTGLTPGAF